MKNWDAARIIRLIIGVGVAIYSIVSEDYLFLVLSLFFLWQAVLNTSCCSGAGCSIRQSEDEKQRQEGTEKEITK